MKNVGILYQNLRARHRKRKNITHRKTMRGAIANRVPISLRPGMVNQQQRFGDWEIDLENI